MFGGLEKSKKRALGALLIAGVACAVTGTLYWSQKWIESAGLIFDIAGIVQLEIGGLFDRLLDKYADEKKYPYGPPSHITRQLSDEADRPIRAWLYNNTFYEHRTGFWLLVLGFVFQLWANWL